MKMTTKSSTGVHDSELVTADQPDEHRHRARRAADHDVLLGLRRLSHIVYTKT